MQIAVDERQQRALETATGAIYSGKIFEGTF